MGIIKDFKEKDLDSVVASADYLTPDQYQFLWKKLLNELKINYGADNSIPTLDKDIRSTSLLDIIQQNCDLPSDEDNTNLLISTFYKDIKNNSSDNFWNESLDNAIKFFLDHFALTDGSIILKIPKNSGEHSITIGTLKKSDAGFSFVPEEWVRPFYNINNKNYNEVREHDQVITTLNRDNKLQFTHEQTSDWIRLIMPQYGRRVEIEDLDRNFWVIAQVLSSIGNFIMDDNSPIVQMFKFLLKEITELWENILFLWLKMIMTSQKQNDDVQVIVLPLQNQKYRNDMRFDNFNNIIDFTKDADKIISINKIYGITDTLQNENRIKKEIFNHIKYLAEQYSEQNLCIIPYFRLNNYKHNYYAGEYYRYMYIYNQKKGDYSNLDNWDIYKLYEDSNTHLIISPYYEIKKRFSSKIYGFKYTSEEKYLYTYPFSDIESAEGIEDQIWLYGGLRTIIDVSFKKSAKDIIPSNITFQIYDAMREGLDSNKEYIGTYKNLNITNTTDIKMIQFNYENSVSWTIPTAALTINEKSCNTIEKAAYLGECATWKLRTAELEKKDVFTSQSYIVKIGSFMPKNNNYSKFVTAHMNNEENATLTSMRGNVTWAMTQWPPSSIGSDVVYYRNNWESYTGRIYTNDNKFEYDNIDNNVGESIAHTGIPYNLPPEAKKLDYVTQSNLRKDGLIAAKQFIKAAYDNKSNPQQKEIYTNPCYITSAIGLTPWWRCPGKTTFNNPETYWDVGGICHIYLYIPHANSIKEKWSNEYEVRTEDYQIEYDKPEVSAYDYDKIVGTIYSNDNKEIGKIISCGLINRYETFFDNNIRLVQPENWQVYVRTSSAWRQFEIKNINDNNICRETIVNGGKTIDNGYIIYRPKFNKDFLGEINYYDVRWYQNNTASGNSLFNPKAQVSTARVRISENNYIQEEKGKISECNQFELSSANRGQRALDVNNTGFPLPSGDNGFMGTFRNNDTVLKYHGNTTYAVPQPGGTAYWSGYAIYTNP